MSPTLRPRHTPLLMGGASCTRSRIAPLGRGAGGVKTLASSIGDEQNTAPEPGKGSGASISRRTGGDWAALEKGGGRGDGSDYLAEMGQAQDYNINVDHGQNWSNIDYIFAGEKLGHKADIADGSLRNYEMRSLNNIVGDYYIAPRFLEEVALHIAKNILCDNGQIDARVPLILGIWGGKGQGKSFQVELAFKKLGVVPIIMSAGELEHEWAGTPGRLIRERYCKAADVLKNQGKLSCLLINDLDAGIGRFGDTQVTVNNQMVVGTLMNLCDSPNMVSLGKDWKEDDFVNRVPIIVTGNDFSKVYAPLIRDGRMEKFYWSPSRADLTSILHAMYKDDGFQEEDMEVLLDEFPNQPLDFYGAIRASTHDQHIRDWLFVDVLKGKGANDWEEADLKELRRRLVFKQDLPQLEHIDITLNMLLEEGRRLAQEQDHVMQNKLSEEYLKNLSQEREVARTLEEERAKEAAKPTVTEPPPPPSQAYLEKLAAAREALKEAGFREEVQVEPEYVEEAEAAPWPQLPPREAMALVQDEGYAYIDIRPAKDFERDNYKKATSLPFAKISGFGANAVTEELQDFVPEIRGRFPDLSSKLLLVGGDDGEFAADALSKLQEEGYQEVAEVLGGFAAWTLAYRPNGEARAAGGGWMSAEGREELFGTGG